jgi:predicted nucleic acid-binding Zn ribbon protein
LERIVAAMSTPNANARGPRPLADVLGELFAARGYGRLHASNELEAAWEAALGEGYAGRTRLGDVRRGVLTVTVDHPALLEELSAYRKAELLRALRATARGSNVAALRFRIGPVEA